MSAQIMPGPLIAIGGHEDREGERRILRIIADNLRGKPLGLLTAASRQPRGYVDEYRRAFDDLDVSIEPVSTQRIAEGKNLLADCGGVFMSGGNQERLVERLVHADFADLIRALWAEGGVVAGTSAGASALADRMILRGPGEESPGSTDMVLGDGLGLLEGTIIDQHFAERGRSGRLRAAVALEQDRLGIGIDEDTAIEVRGTVLTVRGAGGVTIIDASDAEVHAGHGRRPATLRSARLHVLAEGDAFDLVWREPVGALAGNDSGAEGARS